MGVVSNGKWLSSRTANQSAVSNARSVPASMSKGGAGQANDEGSRKLWQNES